MLTALKVRALAIIDELEVAFGPGLTALTGETGAGKSILVDALHLVLGGRAAAEVVRTGAEEASVEALFAPEDPVAMDARLLALGLPAGGAELVVRRVIAREGRSRGYVNGALASAAQLARATRGLVDISGQHEHVSLLDAASHLDLLDAHAGLAALRERYAAAYATLAEAARAAAQLDTDEAERARRADYLRFCVQELDDVSPEPAEDETLAQERRVLSGAQKLRTLAEEAEALLYSGEVAAVERAGAALALVDEAAEIDAQLAPAAAALRGALAELTEAGRSLGAYARKVEGDPGRLSELEDRLEALRRVARKHGGSLASAVHRHAEMKAELATLDSHDEQVAAAKARVAAAAQVARALAQELSAERHAAAAGFASDVLVPLAELGMSKTKLEVAFTPAGDGALVGLGPQGLERAELLVSPNPGEALRPLAKIASGGELSRVLLAVKSALAGTDPVDTYVFDEVDAGIGGPTGEAVGRLLARVARGRQVVAITHLPQIAAHAEAHLVVEKAVARGRTISRVTSVAREDRGRELARMLGGALSAAALAHAEELLEHAARARARSRGKRGKKGDAVEAA